MPKTPDYTKRAIAKYKAERDQIMVTLPKGYKERIKNITGLSCNAYISNLVINDIERLEKTKES